MENRKDTPAEEERELQSEQASAQEEDPRVALEETIAAQAKRIDDLSRAYAEALNERESHRKRLEREQERQIATAKGEIAEVLLDVVEDLRRALKSDPGEAPALHEGVRLIADELMRRVEQLGLTRIETEGKHFDPLLHEAVDLVPTTEMDQDGKIVDEARAGWRMGERVLRAARVRVARYVPPAQQEPEPESQATEE